MDEDVEKRIRAIRDDRAHGASWLAVSALDVLKAIAEDAPADSSTQLLSILRDKAKELIEVRPSMAPITNLVARLIQEAEAAGSIPLDKLRRTVTEKAVEIANESRISVNRAAENASKLIEADGTFITCSFSSTVFETLTLRPDIRVIVAESRPLFEGRLLAQRLAEHGIRATLITDAAIAAFVNDADAAVVGADSVLADGSIVNKVGTRPLALAADDAGVRFYAATETSKFDARSLMGRAPVLEEGDPHEVAEVIEGVEVRNPYFEVTPARLITAIVTELGQMDVHTIRSRMEEMSRYVEPLLARGKTEATRTSSSSGGR
jgi:eIF-2B alpha/beta/delta-like uncharacterized protein